MSGYLSSKTSTTTNRSSTGFWKGQILSLGSTVITTVVAAAVTVFVTNYFTGPELEKKINALSERISFLEGMFEMLRDKIKD